MFLKKKKDRKVYFSNNIYIYIYVHTTKRIIYIYFYLNI